MSMKVPGKASASAAGKIAGSVAFVLSIGGLAAGPALAEEVEIEMHAISAEGVGNSLGIIHAYDSDNGLVLSMTLSGLTPGAHGFHVHENGSCDPGERDGQMAAGLAAGGHFDPDGGDHHLGPSGEGHKGDLPVIFIEDSAAADGSVALVQVAPRLTVADIKGRALMIHEGGDNYRDEPKPLGGGGGRVACGMVP
jgi:Cu-Zn family superoxide dismutase